MTDKQLIQSESSWREQVEEQQALLENVRNELIEAEAELAERLAAINAFEFTLRSRIGPLLARLEGLETEIAQQRKQLRQIDEDWDDFTSDDRRWSIGDLGVFFNDAGAAASGDYRYVGAASASPPQELDAEQGAEIKRLYRQLARRFHPDMALNEADRDYRTGMMMAINAAYAAGDLEKLRELMLEPDSASRLEFAQTDQQLCAALSQELARCQRRLEEIRRELAGLERHKSTRLMRRVQQATAEGRDFFAEIVIQLKEKFAQKMVERDVLKSEIEQLDAAEPAFPGDDFADTVWSWSLDEVYDEDPLSEMERWLYKRRNRAEWDEDELDDFDWRSLRDRD